MRAGNRTRLTAAVVAGALLLPAAASASEKVVYGGTTDGDGTFAMTVKLSGKGIPKKVTELRGTSLPAHCEKSSSSHINNVRAPFVIKVNKRLKFQGSITDQYGNVKSIDGAFGGRKLNKVKGTFVFSAHYAADQYLPEENCTTGELGYKAKRGGPDVVIPAAV
jgi:hypothetical protein